ncbi:MAG: GTP 3',8-cyclase MoaA [Deltaproteobacteria bacterium]|nr:GTP 3',8-cyclase MoaA [Deltaproteobacteria bacterium]
MISGPHQPGSCPRGYYLRVSVTEACAYRCAYCQPDGPVAQGRSGLAPEQLEALVAALTRVGVHRVRLTGGEPLSRRDCPEIVERLARLPGLAEVALTTNGQRLRPMAAALAEAGLSRLNVHLDSLDPRRHHEITGHDDHAEVLAGIDAAEAAGLPPPKINVVVMRGVNDDELAAFCEHAAATGRTVRFIELMDTGIAARWSREHLVTAAEIRERIAAHFELQPRFADRGASPAQEYLLDGGRATVGIIASESEPFCERCNRLRLTVKGELRGCLYEAGGVPLLPHLEDPARLGEVIARGVAGKRSHHPTAGEVEANRFSMAAIGG